MEQNIYNILEIIRIFIKPGAVPPESITRIHKLIDATERNIRTQPKHFKYNHFTISSIIGNLKELHSGTEMDESTLDHCIQRIKLMLEE